MIRLVLLLFAVLAGTGASGADVDIRLRPSVTLPAAQATLADIADISGDAQLASTLASLTIIDLPTLGEHCIDERTIRQSLGRTAVGRVTVSGKCQLRRATHVVSTEDLIAAARAAVSADGDTVHITVVKEPPALAIPASAQLPTLIAAPLDNARTGTIPFTIRILDNGRECARTLVTLRIERLRTVPVAARALRRGDILSALDVASCSIAVDAHSHYLSRDLALGQVVRLDMKEGAPFTTMSLIPSRDVRGGTSVVVTVGRSGFAVTGNGTALADGSTGDMIPVRRASDGRVINARITGPGQVTPQ